MIYPCRYISVAFNYLIVLSIIMTRFKQPTMPYLPTVAFAFGEGGVALGEQRKEDLERFCELLNSTEQPELKEHLRQLVKAWQESGPNLIKMMDPMPLKAYESMESLFTTMWSPTGSGRATLWVMPDDRQLERLFGGKEIFKNEPDGTRKLIPEAEAWVEFGFFTLNPHCEELAGPCARCGNYYVKKRATQKVYCSRRCGQAATAVVRTGERLKAEHKDKIRRARAVIREWNTLKTRPALEWKVWLKKREPDITQKFVTRWANKNKLPKPKRERG